MPGSILPSSRTDPDGAFVLIRRLFTEFGLAQWKRYAVAFALMGVAAGCTALSAYLMGVVINEAYVSRNITPDPASGIGKWSLAEIADLLKTGQTPDFDFVGSAMGEVVKGTSKLTDADRAAIAVYVKSLPPISTPKPAKKE